MFAKYWFKLASKMAAILLFHVFLPRLSPAGICFLVAGAIVSAENIGSVFESLALYIGTCIAGLIIHSFVVYPLLYFIFTRKNPLKFFSGMIEAVVTAFGTSSRLVFIARSWFIDFRENSYPQSLTRNPQIVIRNPQIVNRGLTVLF